MNENSNSNHECNILNRKLLSLSGVNKIINFDSKNFVLESIMGIISIKGNNMELLNFDKSIIRIKGYIDSLNYLDKNNVKKNEESFFAKLFK